MILEVCVDSVASAIAAQRGGAHRIELCSSLLEGGLTPGPGLMSIVRERLHIDIFAMIRPRGDDFLYSDDEFEIMQYDIEEARRLGANGFVLGLLHPNGLVDVERTRQLVQQANPLPVTFHRAIDLTPDPLLALEEVIATGAQRILTSGGAPSVQQGSATLRQLRQTASHRIAIMAGGGLNRDNLRQVVETSGVEELHGSFRTTKPAPMDFRKTGVSMGGTNDEYVRHVTDENEVRTVMELLHQIAKERTP
jgi:copper homeostasis protein